MGAVRVGAALRRTHQFDFKREDEGMETGRILEALPEIN